MNARQTIVVIDFGGQYNQLIARRVRDMGVYSELVPYTVTAQKVASFDPIGIILTGGPLSAFGADSPKLDKGIYELGVPVLGICYGMQITAHLLGGEVAEGKVGEFGGVVCHYDEHPLLAAMGKEGTCWMSHRDKVVALPEGFVGIARTKDTEYAAMACDAKRIYGVQFHPEVLHTEHGLDLMHSFVYDICGAKGDWTMSNFIDEQVAALRKQLDGKKVLLGLSGGVDSSVLAALLYKACPDSLICVFVDHGLLRKNEREEVEEVFGKQFGVNLITADAAGRFLKALEGVVEPERKRKIIGETFVRVFEEEARKIGKVDYLAQGTIYPDRVESGVGNSAVIKSHHNVGGLPSVVDFDGLVEPLRDLFKDEVRRLGFALGLPRHIVMRQPFPGPGLGVRVLGEITEDKLRIVREADYIFREEIAKAGLDESIWQYFAALSNMRSVGVKGDSRSYDYAVVLRAVASVDAMTAEWYKIPYDVLDVVSTRITNEVSGVNRVLYDITNKPPATIELE